LRTFGAPKSCLPNEAAAGYRPPGAAECRELSAIFDQNRVPARLSVSFATKRS
jgi:hypothetical protein